MDNFLLQIIRFISSDGHLNEGDHQSVIKQHTEKLNKNGDIGFSILWKAWKNYLHSTKFSVAAGERLFDEEDSKFQSALIQASAQWPFQIERIEFMPNNRCALFLNRTDCFGKVINFVLQNAEIYGRRYNENNNNETQQNAICVDVSIFDDKTLTGHRCLLIKNVLTNLLKTNGWSVVVNDSDENQQMQQQTSVMRVLVTHSRHRLLSGVENKENDNNNNGYCVKEEPDNRQITKIFCGEIKDDHQLLAADYIRRRSLDMERMAELKYGEDFEKAIIYNFDDLGWAATAFDLLKIKHTNVVTMDNLIKQSNVTKGAAFVLYNVARLQSIFHTFEEKVRDGYYNKLPEFNEIDFNLLKEEEEWQLVYVHILGYPNVIERSIGSIQTGQIALHVLCNFLSNFVALFSAYYHRVKILTDNLPHLMPTMYARIYLLMAIRTILLKSLRILEIKPVDQM